MTNPMINPQPNYSGVTIQISNPAVNVGRENRGYGIPQQALGNYAQGIIPNNQFGYCEDCTTPSYMTNPAPQPQVMPQAYPAQYYLNNYNYQANGKPNSYTDEVDKNQNGLADGNNTNLTKADVEELKKQLDAINGYSTQDTKNANSAGSINSENKDALAANNSTDANNGTDSSTQTINGNQTQDVKPEIKEEDMSKSNGIINDLDARDAQIKAEEKNSKQKRVVALTDEYIKSLENYLNNPNDEIRLMASKEILMRLDEDKNRYDDAALNALLNKMMQDPSKLIRIAALSAFASQLASGNDYTVQLLHNIQANPNADKEDVLQAADILLKMSGGTEIKNIPNPAVKEEKQSDDVKGQ